MFGMNEKIGRSTFKNSPEDSLKVTSMFYTLQGEGPFRGFPAYFIRLTHCQLACSFCDTYFDRGDYMTFNSIFHQINHDIGKFHLKRDLEVPAWARTSPMRIVLVLTGGEPTLQTNIVPFLEQANNVFYHTQIESNGLLFVDLPEKTTLVVSPKCFEKNGVATKYLNPNPDVLNRADCLKFVMSAPEVDTYSPYSEVPDWALDWTQRTGKPIFVSPMNMYNTEPQKAKEMRAEKEDITLAERSNTDEVISFWEEGLLDMKANQRNHEYTAEYAMRHGLILNLQVHLYASLP